MTQKNSIKTSLGPINGDHVIVITPYNTSDKTIKKPFLNKAIESLQSSEEYPTLLNQVQIFLSLFFEALIEGKLVKVSTLLEFCPDLSTPDEKKKFSLLTNNLEEIIKESFNDTYIPFKNRSAIHGMMENTFPITFSIRPVITSDQHHHILFLDIQFAIEWTKSHSNEEFEKSCQKFTKSALFILNQHLPVFCSQLRCLAALYHIAFELNQKSLSALLEEKKIPFASPYSMITIQVQNTIPLLNLAHIFTTMSDKQQLDCREMFDTLIHIKNLSELKKKMKEIQKITQDISRFFIKTIYTVYDPLDPFFDILSGHVQYQSFEFIRTHFSYDTVKKNIEKAVKEILVKLFSSLKIEKNEIALKKKYKRLKHLLSQKSQFENAIDLLSNVIDQLYVKWIVTKKVKDTLMQQQTLSLILQKLKLEKKYKQSNFFFDQESQFLNAINQLENAIDNLDWKWISTKKVMNKTAIQQLKRNIKELSLTLEKILELFLKIKKVNLRKLTHLQEKLEASKIFLHQFKEDPMSILKQHSLSLPYLIRCVEKIENLVDLANPQQIKQILNDELYAKNRVQFLKSFSVTKTVQIEFFLRAKQTKKTPILTEKFLLENQCFFENLTSNIPIEGLSLIHLKNPLLESGQVFRVEKKSFAKKIPIKIESKEESQDITLFQRQPANLESSQVSFLPAQKKDSDSKKINLELIIQNSYSKVGDHSFLYSQQVSILGSIHEKTKYWVFLKALISRQWPVNGYGTFEECLNFILKDLNESDITKKIILISLLVYYKAKNAMAWIKNHLSDQNQEEWDSAMKMTPGLSSTTSLFFLKNNLEQALSKKTAPDYTEGMQKLTDEWIQKIANMTSENIDQIIEKKEDEPLFSTAQKTRFTSMTFLQLMIYCGTEECVTDYLKKIKNNRDKVLKENSESQTVIHFLAFKGFWKTTQRLLLTFDQSLTLFSKDCHGKTPLEFAIQEDQNCFIQVMLEKQIKYSDLNERNSQITQWVHEAVAQHARQVLSYLIKLKKDALFSYNHLGQTPLMSAAKDNQLTLLKMLIDQSFIDQYAVYGCTALHIAIQENALEASLMLIQKGADPQLEDLYARTAFHMAASQGNVFLMIKIMKKKASLIDQCDFFGNTALHYAAYADHAKVVSFLVKKGFDPHKRNRKQDFHKDFMNKINQDHRGLFEIEATIPKYQHSPADIALTQISYLTYLACFDPDHPCLNESKKQQELRSQLWLPEEICQKMAEHGFKCLLKEKNLQERVRGLNHLLVLLGQHRFLTACNNILSLQECQRLLIEKSIFNQEIFFKVLIEKIRSDKDFFETLNIIITKGSPLSLRYFLKHPTLLSYQSGDWESCIKSAIQSQKEEMTIYLALDHRLKKTSLKELSTLALKNKQQHAVVLFLLMGVDIGFEKDIADLWKHQVQLQHPRLFSVMICQLELKKKNDPKADVLMRIFNFIFKNEKAFFKKEIQLLYFFQDDTGETIFHYLVKQDISHYAEFISLLLEEEYTHSLFFLENKKQKCALTLLLEKSLTHQYWEIVKKIFKLKIEEINEMKKNKEEIKEILLSKKAGILAGYQQKIKQVFDDLHEDNCEIILTTLFQELNPHEILKYINSYHRDEGHLTDAFHQKSRLVLACLYQNSPEVFQAIIMRYPLIPLQFIFESMIESDRVEIEVLFFDYLKGLYLFSDSIKSRLHQKPILTLLRNINEVERGVLIDMLLQAFFSQGAKVEKEFSKILDVMRELNDRLNIGLFLKKLEEILKKETVKVDRLDEKIFIILNVTFRFMPIESAHLLLKHQHKLKKDAFKNFLLTQKTSILQTVNQIMISNHFFKKQGNPKMKISFSDKDFVHQFLAIVEESKCSAETKAQVCIYVLDDYYENKSQNKRRKKHSLDLNQGVRTLFHQSDRGCFNKRRPSVEFLNSLKMATRWYVRSAQKEFIGSGVD